MTWYQVAYDQNAEHGKRWVILSFAVNPAAGVVIPNCVEMSRWPTRHEAEGHARKYWERFR